MTLIRLLLCLCGLHQWQREGKAAEFRQCRRCRKKQKLVGKCAAMAGVWINVRES